MPPPREHLFEDRQPLEGCLPRAHKGGSSSLRLDVGDPPPPHRNKSSNLNRELPEGR